jgi:hypothetical protein
VDDWESGFVTTTSTAPIACGGAIATMDVAVCAETVAAAPPNRTETGDAKPVPARVTAVPPTPGPDAGDRVERFGAGEAGGATKENAAGSVTLCPSGLVTVTGCGPAAWAGVVTTSDPGVLAVTVAATPPTETTLPPEPGTKPLPVRVTVVPPNDDPVAGLTPVIEGGDARGRTLPEGADAGPLPTAFVARTLKAYVVPFASPEIEAVVPLTVTAADGVAGRIATE